MNMHTYNDEEGFKGSSGASLRFIDEAKKILSFVGVNPKAEEFFPRDSSWKVKEVFVYILQKNAEREAKDICRCRQKILSVALKNLCGNALCTGCKKSFQDTCRLLKNWGFSCPHDIERKISTHEFLIQGFLQYCLDADQKGDNCLTYLNNTYSNLFEDNVAIFGNDDSYCLEEVAHQSTEEEFYEEVSYEEDSYEEDSYEEDSYDSYEEESYIPYSGVEDLTPEFSAVSKSSEIVYYPIKWNPYNETFFNVKQN